jgi:general secretion pathway protein N
VIFGLLLTTLIDAPARWLTAALQQATQQRVQFQEVRGTVWNGSARLLLTGGVDSRDAAALPGRMNWQLGLGTTGWRAQVYADCCMQQAWRIDLHVGWNGFGLAFADQLSQWPAQILSGLGTPWNTVQAQGQLLLSTQALSVQWLAGRTVLSGSAQLDASHISSRLSTLKPMGSYRVQLFGGAQPGLALSTLEGELQLSGTGQWLGNRLRFEGVASAAPQRLDALGNLLNIIGRREGPRSIITLG